MDGLNENTAPVVQKKDGKLFFAGILLGAMVMAMVLLIVVIAITRKYQAERSRYSGEEEVNVSEGSAVIDEDLVKKIDQIQSLIDEKSIFEPDLEEQKKGIINGYLGASSDKYAKYYSPEEINDQMTSYSGRFYGIGVLMGFNEYEQVLIHKVYDNSPASRAGFHAGDIITEVEGEEVEGWSLDEVVKHVRGERGTRVKITVWREDIADYLELVPIRDEIEEVIIEYEMEEDGIGMIYIQEWYDTTSKQFKDAYDALVAEGMNKGLIIDLRSNTGGLVSAAIETLDVCLPAGPALYIQNNKGERDSYNTYDADEITLPIVIMTNGYTASASEIFTGAMKDYGKAVTLGTKTYGKGVMQSFYYLFDDSAIKLTTEEFYSPKGSKINEVGFDADIEVEFDSSAYYDEENPVDNQLQAAIEYIRGL